MEVHAHTHRPDPPDSYRNHRGRKKWTHYFWEFLMLFLAVFCGFIAEYLLEHKIEKEKGRQYIHSFYEDLKTDTANFERLILEYKSKMQVLETRAECFDTINHTIKSTDCLEALFNNSRHFPDLVYTDRTLQQLKNAGGLRLLSTADADSILLYDNMLKQYTRAETTSFQETQTAIRNTLYSLMNYEKRRPGAGGVSLLVADYRELLNRYFNQLETYSGYCNNNIEDIAGLKSKATTLVNYFKNKYKLK